LDKEHDGQAIPDPGQHYPTRSPLPIILTAKCEGMRLYTNTCTRQQNSDSFLETEFLSS
jgi:hypothetical protein